MITAQIEKNPMMLSGIQLAYIGDSVYELLVRSYIIKNFDYNVNQMHNTAVNFVKAEFQSKIIKEMKGFFSEHEYSVIKRGRNSKNTSHPRNACLIDYKNATGFEALIGFLYLKNDFGRIFEIFDKVAILHKGEKS